MSVETGSRVEVTESMADSAASVFGPRALLALGSQMELNVQVICEVECRRMLRTEHSPLLDTVSVKKRGDGVALGARGAKCMTTGGNLWREYPAEKLDINVCVAVGA